jgi:RimJ/RimL family protein N-acetyltransferase
MQALLRILEPSDSKRLFEMYSQFEPKGEFQGLPPQTTPQIKKWLAQLTELGFFQFVVEVDGRIVGHSMLCPSQAKTEAELAIFVHQDYRGRGFGRKLLLGTLNFGCKRVALQSVWLFVTGANTVALRLFEDVGFHPRANADPLAWEIEMERPSHCLQCKGDKCAVFGEAFPMWVVAQAHCATKR